MNDKKRLLIAVYTDIVLPTRLGCKDCLIVLPAVSNRSLCFADVLRKKQTRRAAKPGFLVDIIVKGGIRNALSLVVQRPPDYVYSSMYQPVMSTYNIVYPSARLLEITCSRIGQRTDSNS